MVRKSRKKIRKYSYRTRKHKGGNPNENNKSTTTTAATTAVTTTTNSTAAPSNKQYLDCDAEGFTYEMRIARLGHGYGINVGQIHYDAEQWDYDRLVDFSSRGIIDWYIRTLKEQGVEFTQAELTALENNEVLDILGAFYHRYKIVAERFAQLRGQLRKGVSNYLIKYQADNEMRGINSFKKYKNSSKNEGKPFRKDILKMAEFIENPGMGADLPFESAIDKAQCLMFYIVKHKGELPPGFVMDPRILERAKMPILINGEFKDESLSRFAATKIQPTVEWLDFFTKTYEELSNPPVTFGVFE